jgi:hypothetical protein
MTLCRSRHDPGGAIPPWRSEFQISHRRFHISCLEFDIGHCHPEGHAFAPEGLCLDRLCSMNNPGLLIISPVSGNAQYRVMLHKQYGPASAVTQPEKHTHPSVSPNQPVSGKVMWSGS